MTDSPTKELVSYDRERLVRLARFITVFCSERKDHACCECYPDGGSLVNGFQCALHESRNVIEFSCRVCSRLIGYSSNGACGPVCEGHCPDHEYEYDEADRWSYCKHCGKAAPEDWHDDSD